MRVDEALVGLRIDDVARGEIGVTLFSDRSISADLLPRLQHRIRSSYGLEDDLSRLDRDFAIVDRSPRMDRLRGMRSSCPESVFEIAIISLLLQNTTIARTTQMMDSLMSSYGHVVRFDGVSLRAFFSPREIADVSEMRLRAENRLGYRAKYLPEFSAFFASSQPNASEVDGATLVEELKQIRGVGDYTANVIASSVLRDPSAVPLDVWNVQILHQALFGEIGRDRERVTEALRANFSGVEGLAALYYIEDRYLDAPLEPIRTDESEARRISRQREAEWCQPR